MLTLTFPNSGTAHITLNRPEVHNAFNAALIGEITDTFTKLKERAGLRAVIISGNGKSFSAGGDLTWMKQVAAFSRDENLQDAGALAAMLSAIYTCPVPVIAVVHGAVMGGGVGLASAADIVIASEDAKFALSEVKLGLTPATISPYVMAAMGARAARRYFVSGERFDAHTALQLGLVHSTAPDKDSALADAEALAATICQNAPEAVREAKALILDLADQGITPEVMQETATRIAARRASHEAREGISAFFEKRAPAWQTPTTEEPS